MVFTAHEFPCADRPELLYRTELTGQENFHELGLLTRLHISPVVVNDRVFWGDEHISLEDAIERLLNVVPGATPVAVAELPSR